MVIDFAFGKDRQYYFQEIRGIKSQNLTKIWEIGNTEEILNLVEQKSIKLLVNSDPIRTIWILKNSQVDI